MFQFNYCSELPWDEPTTGCAEFVNWKSDNSWMTISPWNKLETLALSLLRKILQPNLEKRITVKKIIEHKWCKTKQNLLGMLLCIHFIQIEMNTFIVEAENIKKTRNLREDAHINHNSEAVGSKTLIEFSQSGTE